MKSNIVPLLGTITLAFLATLVLISFFTKNPQINKEPENLVEVQKINDDKIMERVKQIALCESSLNPKAINFKDSDGLTRFGMFQWLPSTFKEYGTKYGLVNEKADMDWIMTIIWDEKINKRLVYMILKNEPETAKKLWGNCY